MFRKLSLNVVRLLLSVCPDFHWVRYIDSWRSNSRTQIGKYYRKKERPFILSTQHLLNIYIISIS
jgi:hypothetical protein